MSDINHILEEINRGNYRHVNLVDESIIIDKSLMPLVGAYKELESSLALARERVEEFELMRADRDMFQKDLALAREGLKLKTQNEINASVNKDCLDGARIQVKKLQSDLALAREQLKEFKVFGTDECPDCERAQVGESYNRTTLYYRPSEHRLHLDKKEGE